MEIVRNRWDLEGIVTRHSVGITYVLRMQETADDGEEQLHFFFLTFRCRIYRICKLNKLSELQG